MVKKKLLRDYVSLNFESKSYRYVAAYQYIIKEKDISTVLHSQGHTLLECIRSPKTKKMLLKGPTSGQVRKRKES